MNATNSLSTGTLLSNRYLIKQELGAGGFARTYLIEDLTKNHQKCVLKEFVPAENNGQLNPKSRNLFEQEAKILAKLNHQQIPTFLDWFEEQNKIFIVQQYIEGDNYWELLCKRKENNQLFSEEEIVAWLKDLLTVIDYIHSQKVIHRDISPDNIIYCTAINKPVLIDFGVVKQVMMTAIGGNYSGKQGTMIGKIGYSAPEQLKTGECYPNSDLYALAVTALVLLTGKEPSLLFSSYHREKQWHKYVNINDNLKQILTNMLAEYPSERYKSAQEVLTDLNQINLSSSTSASNQSKKHTIPAKSQVIPSPTEIVTNQRNIGNNKNKYKYIILLSLATLLGLGGVFVGIRHPHITAICKPLDNCARDKEYDEKYQQIVRDGNEISKKKNDPKNINQLVSNYNELKRVISELKQIPDDVKIFTQAEDKLKKYEIILGDIEKKIEIEKKAEQEFNSIVTDINKLKIKTSEAKGIKSYQEVKSEWQKLQDELNNLDKNVFVASQIPGKITESQENIQKIDKQINLLVAEEKRRAEREARIAKPRVSPRKPASTPRQNTSNNRRTASQNTPRQNPSSSPRTPSQATPNNVSRKGSVW